MYNESGVLWVTKRQLSSGPFDLITLTAHPKSVPELPEQLLSDHEVVLLVQSEVVTTYVNPSTVDHCQIQ